MLYRDIDSLRRSGVLIDEASGYRYGYGYCLSEDPVLPPQKFPQLVAQAPVLGSGYARALGGATRA